MKSERPPPTLTHGHGLNAVGDGLRRTLEECLDDVRNRLLQEVDHLERLAADPIPERWALLQPCAAGPWLHSRSRCPSRQPLEPPAEKSPMEPASPSVDKLAPSFSPRLLEAPAKTFPARALPLQLVQAEATEQLLTARPPPLAHLAASYGSGSHLQATDQLMTARAHSAHLTACHTSEASCASSGWRTQHEQTFAEFSGLHLEAMPKMAVHSGRISEESEGLEGAGEPAAVQHHTRPAGDAGQPQGWGLHGNLTSWLHRGRTNTWPRLSRLAHAVTKRLPDGDNSDSSRDFARSIATKLDGREAERKTSLQEAELLPRSVELFFGFLILTNAVMSGYEVQWMSNHLGESLPIWFLYIRHSFTMLFLTELIVRMGMAGVSNFFCGAQSAWAWLDLGCVVSSLLEMVVDIQVAMDEGGSTGSGVMRHVRLLRMLRVSRAFRLNRIIRFISALRTLVYSIMVTLQSLFWALVLLMMIWYVFGLALTLEAVEFIGDAKSRGEEHLLNPDLIKVWGSLDNSMFALFQSISGGVSWKEYVEPLDTMSWFPVPLFTTYIFFTYFAVLNVVTAVFCSSAIETTHRNPEIVAAEAFLRKRSTSNHLRTLFNAIDRDGSGLITLAEIEQMEKDELAIAWFKALDIDFRDAWTLFKLLDSEKEGTIRIEDFLKGCEQLQGRASTIAVAEMQYDVKKLHTRMKTILDTVDAHSNLRSNQTERLHQSALNCHEYTSEMSKVDNS